MAPVFEDIALTRAEYIAIQGMFGHLDVGWASVNGAWCPTLAFTQYSAVLGADVATRMVDQERAGPTRRFAIPLPSGTGMVQSKREWDELHAECDAVHPLPERWAWANG